MLIMASLMCFTSCSKDDDNDGGGSNPMVGTKWTANSWSGDNVYVIDFYSNTEFKDYMTDKYGNIINTGVDYGTYIYNDGIVTFKTHSSTSPYKNAKVKGDIMTLTYLISGTTRDYMKK